MNEERGVELSFELSVDDQFDQAMLDWRVNQRPAESRRGAFIVKAMLGVALAAVITFHFVSTIKQGISVGNASLILIVVVGMLAVVAYVVPRPRDEKWVGKALRRQLDAQVKAGTLRCVLGPTSARIGPTGVFWSVGHSTTHVEWQGVDRVDADERVLRFLSRSGGVIFIPARAMTPAQREQILKLAAERITPAAAR